MRICILLLSLWLVSCSREHDRKQAEKIVEAAIQVHGGSNFIQSKVEFDFRDIHYSVTRAKDSYTYTRSFQKDSSTIKDVLVSSSEFVREVNGQHLLLPDSMKAKYSNSVNSVLYFFQLPLVLRDPAAHKEVKGRVRIKGEPYYEIKVTFAQEQGGVDFEDEFYFWIHEKSHLLDYLAYSYQTDGGGVRFREAYNRYEVGGILFQDYINFKAPLGTPLYELPEQYQSGTLEILSKIENQNIQVTRLPKQ